MKTSPAGKVLGPQSGAWEVVQFEGEPCIKTPGGRLLRVQQFHYGRWELNPFGPSDLAHLVTGANMLREYNATLKAAAEQRAQDNELGDQR